MPRSRKLGDNRFPDEEFERRSILIAIFDSTPTSTFLSLSLSLFSSLVEFNALESGIILQVESCSSTSELKLVKGNNWVVCREMFDLERILHIRIYIYAWIDGTFILSSISSSFFNTVKV